MPAPKKTAAAAKVLETVEPLGERVLVRKDEDKKQTKSGIHLPDNIEIPRPDRRGVGPDRRG